MTILPYPHRSTQAGDNDEPGADYSRSLALLVSDALANTPTLTERGRDVLVVALLAVASPEPVTTSIEAALFRRMLDAGLRVTAPFDPSRWRPA